MRAVLADSGPLYAAVDVDDTDHARAQQELGRISEEGWAVIVAFPTVLECYTLLLRRLPIPSVHGWLAEIQKGAILVNPEHDDYIAAFSEMQRYSDQPITLFDGVVAAIGSRLRVPIWTYDYHFDVMRASVWR
jgi:predicted nucleic acid-binding protein